MQQRAGRAYRTRHGYGRLGRGRHSACHSALRASACGAGCPVSCTACRRPCASAEQELVACLGKAERRRKLTGAWLCVSARETRHAPFDVPPLPPAHAAHSRSARRGTPRRQNPAPSRRPPPALCLSLAPQPPRALKRRDRPTQRTTATTARGGDIKRRHHQPAACAFAGQQQPAWRPWQLIIITASAATPCPKAWSSQAALHVRHDGAAPICPCAAPRPRPARCTRCCPAPPSLSLRPPRLARARCLSTRCACPPC